MEEIKFEKVSYEQFYKDSKKLGFIDEEIKEAYDGIVLPKRGTKGSAGYDFVTPFAFELYPRKILGKYYSERKVVTLPTGIRAKMPQNVCLVLMPRSGLGFKSGMYLANTLGLIDSDYYYSDNEGHIMMKFCYGFSDLEVKQFERVMQGVFLPYFQVDNDTTSNERNGGFGSTGR